MVPCHHNSKMFCVIMIQSVIQTEERNFRQCYELCETPCSTEHLPYLCHDICDKLSTFTYG
ncbi:hypothetical protein D917_03731 [Trichinella nativa]|uniref:Uncharacterized protein n=1 Tax=Trichinella nativa TaxID=6335 RepID=A0A1Y3E8A3_9BILA|nr:hypothetical protein D917_03731 [Trichinella nativa]